MRNDVIHLISHLPEDVNDVLEGSGDCGADHVVGATGFTADAKLDGEDFAQHRFALLLVADPTTAHEMLLNNQIGIGVVQGLVDRFRDMLAGVFGEEMVAAAMLEGMAAMFGLVRDDDDEMPENNNVLN